MKVYVQCDIGVNKNALFASIQASIANGARLSLALLNQERWRMEVWSGGTRLEDHAVPTLTATEPQTSALNEFKNTRKPDRDLNETLGAYNQYTANIGGAVLSRQNTTQEIYENQLVSLLSFALICKELHEMNNKRVEMDKAADLGMDLESYKKLMGEIERLQNRDIFSLKIGQAYNPVIS